MGGILTLALYLKGGNKISKVRSSEWTLTSGKRELTGGAEPVWISSISVNGDEGLEEWEMTWSTEVSSSRMEIRIGITSVSQEMMILYKVRSYTLYVFCPWLYPKKMHLSARGSNFDFCGNVLDA